MPKESLAIGRQSPAKVDRYGGDGGGIVIGSRSNVKVRGDDRADMAATGFATGRSLQIVLIFILKPIERERVTFWKTIL